MIYWLILLEQECGPRDCGVLAARVTHSGTARARHIRVEFAAVHGSKSMGFAYYQPCDMDKPVSYVMRQPNRQDHMVQLACLGYVCNW